MQTTQPYGAEHAMDSLRPWLLKTWRVCLACLMPTLRSGLSILRARKLWPSHIGFDVSWLARVNGALNLDLNPRHDTSRSLAIFATGISTLLVDNKTGWSPSRSKLVWRCKITSERERCGRQVKSRPFNYSREKHYCRTCCMFVALLSMCTEPYLLYCSRTWQVLTHVPIGISR